MNTWNNSDETTCYQCQRPRPTHDLEENRRSRLPPDAHMWWECPHCSTSDYRVNEAVKDCPDCKHPRPETAVSYLRPLYVESNTNRQRVKGRKAKARIRKQQELAEASRLNAQLLRQQGQRHFRHPQRSAREPVEGWVTTDGDDAWANWPPSTPGPREDETAPDRQYPWRRSNSAGASLA